MSWPRAATRLRDGEASRLGDLEQGIDQAEVRVDVGTLETRAVRAEVGW
jgi:hypothetical protein